MAAVLFTGANILSMISLRKLKIILLSLAHLKYIFLVNCLEFIYF